MPEETVNTSTETNANVPMETSKPGEVVATLDASGASLIVGGAAVVGTLVGHGLWWIASAIREKVERDKAAKAAKTADTTPKGYTQVPPASGKEENCAADTKAEAVK